MTSTEAVSLPDLATLPDDVGVLKQLVAQLCEALHKERAEHLELRQNFDLFLKRFWRPKSEKGSLGQLPLFDKELDPELLAMLAAPAAPQPPPSEAPAKSRQGAHGRRRCPDTLERQVVVHDLTDAEKTLLGGAAGLKQLEDQITTQYEWRSSSLFVIEHHQRKYVRIEALADAEALPAAPRSDVVAENVVAENVVAEQPVAETAGLDPIAAPVADHAAVAIAAEPTAASDETAPPVARDQATADRKTWRRMPSAAERAAGRAHEEIRGDLKSQVDALFPSAIIVAPKPPQAIPGGLAGPNLLAQTLVSKYADHLPLYRLERIFARHGVRFSRSTLCDWCAACARLLKPLVELIRGEVLSSFVIHTDDTPVDVRGARTKEKYQARFWTYWGDDQHPLVWFDFTKSRKRSGPDAVLRTFRGYLQADGYGGYDDYEGVELSDTSPILKVACWAHARRKFRDAHSSDPTGAALAQGFIRRLYVIEREIDKQLAATGAEWSPEARAKEVAAQRQQRARPVLDEFRKWLDTTKPKLLPKSPLAKAINYTLNQWDGLRRYLDDGRLMPDNNKAERALRGIALGRKNWLFCGSEAGGHTAAALFSLIASAVRNGHDPYQYLACLLTEIPLLGDSPTPEQLRSYLPHLWRPPDG